MRHLPGGEEANRASYLVGGLDCPWRTPKVERTSKPIKQHGRNFDQPRIPGSRIDRSHYSAYENRLGML